MRRGTVEERRAAEEAPRDVSPSPRIWPYDARYSAPQTTAENMRKTAYVGRTLYDAAMCGKLDQFMNQTGGLQQ